MKSSDKWGCISVTVGDRENFIESEIVERKILHWSVVLLFALGPFFNGFGEQKLVEVGKVRINGVVSP